MNNWESYREAEVKNNKHNNPFRIIFPKGSFGKDDVIVGTKFKVLNDPKPYTRIVKSKYRIVNWLRKLFKCEIKESGYCYEVKMLDK